MCPENEVTFRVTNQLIHKLEEGKFMVKEYQRPAADKTDHSAVSEKVWCICVFISRYRKLFFYKLNRGIRADHAPRAHRVATSSGTFGMIVFFQD